MHFLKNFKKNIINQNITLKESLILLNNLNQKCLIITDKNKKLIGTLTEGDVLRSIVSGAKFYDRIKNFINKNSFYLNIDKINEKKSLNDFNIPNDISLIPILNDKRKIIKVLRKSNLFNKQKYNSTLNAQVIIMAGGLGTRLKPYSSIIPKPLFPFEGKAIIEHIMEKFDKYNFKKFLISINSSQKIIKVFLKSKNKNNVDFIYEKKLLGTAGSLGLIKKVTKNFFVINCDSIIDCNYRSILNYHNSNNNDCTIVVAKKKIDIPYGIFELQKDKKIKMKEKPSYDILINTGMYIFSKNILKFIKKNKKIDMDKFIEKLLKNKSKVDLFPIESKEWSDFGQLSSFSKKN
ncbi:NTP transferase domain-containing protein [Pelagibacterales bacterium SAG-MED46]|nr:NTP transferase domain-containing protein [Pelagibacterales bacterium SAG-MED46]